MRSNLTPFHLAIPVNDLDAARNFYGGVLDCPEGRSSATWIDFNLLGHQLVCHLAPSSQHTHHNPVDGKQVPVPHFGVVLSMEQFEDLSARLKEQGIQFIIEPYIRFAGEVGEQATMFFSDPAGNALEFKAFKNIDQLFAK